MALDAAASRTQPLASRLHKSRGAMGRFFLSGQTTCALLLGAGLLLRAQSALRSNEPAPRAPRAHPAEMFPERTPPAEAAPRAVKGASERDGKKARRGKARSQAGKAVGHRLRRSGSGCRKPRERAPCSRTAR